MNTVGRISVVSILIVGIILVGRLSLIDSEENRTVSSLTWTGCGGSNYFTVSDIKVLGDFSKGSTVSFILSGTVNTAFLHSSTDIKFTLKGLVPFVICDQNFPVSPPKQYNTGPTKIQQNQKMDDDAPAGTYVLDSYIRGGISNAQLQCVRITFVLK